MNEEITAGQKDIESMHEYYWENYTEMDQYGYEDYDNQQALLQRVNANQDSLRLKARYEKMLDSPFSAEWISAMTETTSRKYFTSESGILQKKQEKFR